MARVWALLCVAGLWCGGTNPVVALSSMTAEEPAMKSGGGAAAPARQGLILVPAGAVTQGCNPGRRARCRGQHIGAFWIQESTVSRSDYRKCLDAGVCVTPPSFTSPNGTVYESSPPRQGPADAALVSWFEAEQYCRWQELRLPTEVEWERARESSSIGHSMGRVHTEWLDGWYTWFGQGFVRRRITSGWVSNSRLVVEMQGGASYRYGHEPTAGGAVAFRCVEGDRPVGGGTEEAAWPQANLR